MSTLTVSPSMKKMNRYGLLKRSFSQKRTSLEKDTSITRVKAHPNILLLNKKSFKQQVVGVYKKIIGSFVSCYHGRRNK